MEQQILGAYTLETMIGRGSMGSVWLARRSDGRFEGKVAVKLLNIALLGRRGEERFRREGRVLSRLKHANIARIIDAGVAQSSQPYLVLEHVAGVAIDVYCNDRGLDVEGRLRLFLDVLAAVGHAHANLIVHRDLKPPNILVTADGVVKLLDFSVAKLIEGDLQTDSGTMLTQGGPHAVLTPEYAAPEQLLDAPVTVATDVYSLGVLLYRLLSGRHPTSGEATSVLPLIRSLLETEPQRLSAAVTDPRLKRVLRGDLEVILAKALKKNPLERYASVKELADDLRRYLEDEPVLARPDSPWYRMRKFVARNRLSVGMAILALGGIIATAAVARVEARAAALVRDRALTLSSRNEAVADFLQTLITEAARTKKPVSVHDMLERSEATVRRDYQNDPEHRAAVLDILGVYYASNDEHERGAALVEEARGLVGNSGDEDLRRRLECDHAFTLAVVGRMDEAIRDLKRMVALPDLTPQRAASCLDYLGQALLQDADADAIPYLQRALQQLRLVPHPEQTQKSNILAAIGYGEHLQGRNDLAEQYYEKSMAELVRTGRDRDPNAVTTLNGWALVYQGSGNPKRALQLYERALQLLTENGVESPSRPSILYNRARALELVGHLDDAKREYSACDTASQVQRTPLARVYCVLGLASVAETRGELAAAQGYLTAASKLAGDPLPPNYPAAFRFQTIRGWTALRQGRLDVARKSLDWVIDNSKAAQITSDALRARAVLSLQVNDMMAAERDARSMLSLAQQAQGGLPHSDRTGMAWLMLAQVFAKQGNAAAARNAVQAALDNLSSTVDDGHPMLLEARQLGLLLGG